MNRKRIELNLLDASINSLSKQSWGKPSVKFTRSFLSRHTLEARDKAGIPGKRSHWIQRRMWQGIHGKNVTKDTRKDATKGDKEYKERCHNGCTKYYAQKGALTLFLWIGYPLCCLVVVILSLLCLKEETSVAQMWDKFFDDTDCLFKK